MVISHITPYIVYGVNAPTYSTPAKETHQATKTAAPAAPQAYSVKLSGEALARSLLLQGYTPLMISLKMGLDIKIVDFYLGITV